MDQIQQDFINFYTNTAINFIPDKLAVHLISILFLEIEEISLEELAQKSGFSLASISNKARMLEQMGFLKRTCKPGTKKVYVFIEKDLFKIMREHLLKKQEIMIHQMKQGLPFIIEKHEHKSLTEKERKELKIVKDYLKQISALDLIIKDLYKKLDGGLS